jgi:hypothetical protein
MGLLSNGGTLVVVGARRSNCPEFWDHPQIVFMDSHELSKKGLPTNAKGIVFTRFMGHTDFAVAIGEARSRNITIFPKQTTGALKLLLSQIVKDAYRPSHPPEIPEPSYDIVAQEGNHFTVKHSEIANTIPTPLPITATPPITAEPDAPVEPESSEEPVVMPRKVKNLSVNQVARLLGVSGSAVLLYKKQGKLTVAGKEQRRVGETKQHRSVIVFDRKQVEEFAKEFVRPSNAGKRSPLRNPRRSVKRVVAPPVYDVPEQAAPETTSNIIELVDNAIAALQLIREEALKLQTTRSDFKKRFLELIGG